MIVRKLESQLKQKLASYPAVALLGPRQVGKTTLALQLADQMDILYLDLEKPRDLAKIRDFEWFYQSNQQKLVILDEVQRQPELFPEIRGLIDEQIRQGNRHGLFLFLGSASIDLLKQASETLAGRIAYLELFPLSAVEVQNEIEPLWLRGGFPDSFLAPNDHQSLDWRENFITTYLERDIPTLGPKIPAETLKRFWTMLAHLQGTPLNAAKLAANLGVSGQTIMRYLDLLVDLLLVRRLPPWSGNVSKRLVKSPKVYVRDSGIVHALLGIENRNQLLGHPVLGGSWEGFVIENIQSVLPKQAQLLYYRTSDGHEIDVLIEIKPNQLWAIEIKHSLSPKLSSGFYQACKTLNIQQAYLVYPGRESWTLPEGVQVLSLETLFTKLQML